MLRVQFLDIKYKLWWGMGLGLGLGNGLGLYSQLNFNGLLTVIDHHFSCASFTLSSAHFPLEGLDCKWAVMMADSVRVF